MLNVISEKFADMSNSIRAELVGARIKAVREARGYHHQTEVYKPLAIDATSWSKYEKGERMVPVATLSMIARYLRCPVEYLIEGNFDRMDYELVTKLGLNRV